MAIGYLSGKARAFDEPGAIALNKFVFFVSLPMLVFWLVASVDFSHFPWKMVLAVLFVELMTYMVSVTVAYFLFRRDIAEAVLIGLAAAYPNHVLFVQPVAVILFGESISIPITAIIVIDTTILFGVAVVLMDTFSVSQPSPRRLLKRYVKNPFILAILAGWAASLGQVPIPDGLALFLTFTGRAAAPTALFALGVLLSQRPALANPILPLTVTGIKVLVQPLIAWFVLIQVLGFPPPETIPALMVTAGPSALTAFFLAVNYRVRVDAIAQSILFSVVASLISLSFVSSQ